MLIILYKATSPSLITSHVYHPIHMQLLYYLVSLKPTYLFEENGAE